MIHFERKSNIVIIWYVLVISESLYKMAVADVLVPLQSYWISAI